VKRAAVVVETETATHSKLIVPDLAEDGAKVSTGEPEVHDWMPRNQSDSNRPVIGDVELALRRYVLDAVGDRFRYSAERGVGTLSQRAEFGADDLEAATNFFIRHWPRFSSHTYPEPVICEGRQPYWVLEHLHDENNLRWVVSGQCHGSSQQAHRSHEIEEASPKILDVWWISGDTWKGSNDVTPRLGTDDEETAGLRLHGGYFASEFASASTCREFGVSTLEFQPKRLFAAN
jgi:hypothetical protein